jgi:hypothetical protein
MRIETSEYIVAGSVASNWSLSRVCLLYLNTTTVPYHSKSSISLSDLNVSLVLEVWNMLKLI